MPDAGELFGGFWDGVSAVIDDYAAVASLLSSNAVYQGTAARFLSFTIRADQAVTAYADNGRAVTSYPSPVLIPSWISAKTATSDAVLCRGVDFDLDGDRVLFDVDPLTLYAPETVWDDGQPIAALTLWYGVAPDQPDVPTYESGTFAALVAAVADSCDSPAALVVETVEATFDGSDGWRVVTDRAVYRLGPNDTPSVVASDVLSAGQPLGSGWRLTKLGSDAPELAYVTTPMAFLQGATTGAITWYAGAVPLTIDTSMSRTRVRFPLGAISTGDFNQFWTRSHANGIERDRTLADALDTRTNPTTEPTPADLPTTIDPMAFLCRNLLSGNAWQLVVFPDSFGPAAVDTATRSRAVANAAGPYVAVFEFENTVPALTVRNPT